MESEAFDKQVRSRLRERELQPQPESWDRIAALLDEHEPAAAKRSIWRYSAVAAAVMVLVAVGAGVYFKDAGVAEPIIVVESTPQTETEAPFVSDTRVEQSVQIAARQVEDDSKEPKIKEHITGIPASTEVAQARPLSRPKTKTVASIAALPAQKAVLQSAKKQIAVDQEIEMLLANARAELEVEASRANGAALNAGALLAEVEEELDQNFKDKALDALKNGFVKLRTAVAERNQ